MPRVALAALLLTAPLASAYGATKHRAVAHPPYVAQAAHVFIVVLENTDETVAEELPFIKQLSAEGALLENYHALAHPSQPNYIGMVAGSRYGVKDDNPVTLDARHIGDLLEAKGLTWKVYAENYPGHCYLGTIYGSKETGAYARRHVPFLDFADVQNDTARCTEHIVEAGVLDADIASGELPSYSFYVPNGQHSGHDSNATSADTWLASRFGPLLHDPRFADNVLFIVTYDESMSASNLVTTVLYGPMVKRRVESLDYYDHYSLLRTIEDVLGIGTLGKDDATSRPVTGIWK